MANKLKLDTTMLQSTTAMHLIAFIIVQRELLLKAVANQPVSSKDLKEISTDCEEILTRHTEALHKRCGTRVYNKKSEDLYDNTVRYTGVVGTIKQEEV